RRPEEFFQGPVFQPEKQRGQKEKQVGSGAGERGGVGRGFFKRGGDGAQGRAEVVLGVEIERLGGGKRGDEQPKFLERPSQGAGGVVRQLGEQRVELVGGERVRVRLGDAGRQVVGLVDHEQRARRIPGRL